MSDPRPRKALSATVIALGFTSFFTDAGAEMIFPLLPLFVTSLGGGATFVGLVEGVSDAVSSVLKLFAGNVADRLPRKKPLVLLGYGLSSLVRPAVAFATAPWHVLAVRVTDRVGKGIRSAPRDVLIAAAAPDDGAGRAFGFHRAMDHAGAVVGPLMATTLLGLGLELRTVFMLAAIPGVLAVACVAVVREQAAPATAVAQSADATREPLPRPLRSYFAILFLFALANSSDAFLLLRARELGVSTTAIPLLWAALHVSKLLSAYWGGDLSDRVPRVRLILAGWAIYAFTYLALGFVHDVRLVWLLFVIYGVHYGLTEPAEKALVKDLAPAAIHGRAFGYYNFVLGISAIPASLLTGTLWDRFGAASALGAGAAVSLVAAICLAIWSQRHSARRA